MKIWPCQNDGSIPGLRREDYPLVNLTHVYFVSPLELRKINQYVHMPDWPLEIAFPYFLITKFCIIIQNSSKRNIIVIFGMQQGHSLWPNCLINGALLSTSCQGSPLISINQVSMIGYCRCRCALCHRLPFYRTNDDYSNCATVNCFCSMPAVVWLYSSNPFY